MLKRMPHQDAVILYVDFASLRRSGVLQLLDNARVSEDPEYLAFVRRTEFDYRQDLETALVSFTPQGKYFILRGRFDWKSLKSYVTEQGGSCYNAFCKMPGSAPDRAISMLPLQPTIMGLAVSPDEEAVSRLNTGPRDLLVEVPTDPVWIYVPASVLRGNDSLPAGTRMFAKTMQSAENLVLGLGKAGVGFEARLNVTCRNEGDATAMAQELSRATSLLRNMIERENHAPNPRDLSGVLTSGNFRSEGRRVRGVWTVERSFLENMLAGGTL
jgi:hypothetical protein